MLQHLGALGIGLVVIGAAKSDTARKSQFWGSRKGGLAQKLDKGQEAQAADLVAYYTAH